MRPCSLLISGFRSMLQLEQVTACYEPGVPVLKSVSLQVGADEVVAVLGANGAGKSTLLRVISGLLPVTSGRIVLDNLEITRLPPDRRVQMGIVQVPEGRQMLPGMTVQENILLGGYVRRKDCAGLARTMEEVFQLFPILRERQKQLAGSLSGGQQQMVAIARALMTKPRVLLCDEPSFGVAPLVVKEIFAVLASLRQQGIPILLVEQNAKKALELSDRGVLLRKGETTFCGSKQELLRNELVSAAYLGLPPEQMGSMAPQTSP
jgi:branched-chain amino acid transport system ATP-binding protein